jgi:SnoaL-like domain
MTSLMRRSWLVAAMLLTVATSPLHGQDAAPADVSAVRRVVNDYVGKYRKDSLAEWRALFLPSFTATSPAAAGGVTVRTLDQFYDSQARGFEKSRHMTETLEHVDIAQSGRLATAWADFVFTQDDTSRRGRLVLTLVETEGRWRIAGLLFSY